MPADSFSAGLPCLSWGLTYLMHSTCLIAATWLVLRVYRSASHVFRECLWKIALIGGLLTATAQMLVSPRGPFGGLTLAIGDMFPASADGLAVAQVEPGAAEWPVPAEIGAPATDASQHLADADLWIVAEVPVGEFATARDERTGTADGYTDTLRHAGEGRRITWHTATGAAIPKLTFREALAILVGPALGAIGIGLARCLWQTFWLRRKLARCQAIETGRTRRLLDELCRLVPCARHVRLLAGSDDPEPAAFGVRHWTIVLPERAADELADDELRALLAHELAHLVRGDSLWLLVSRVVCSCLAFQPLNHLARREWQRAAEFLCDSWAVNRTGAPLALARCLTEVAGWRLSGQASPVLLAATGRNSGLIDRIERLLDAGPISETWNGLSEKRRLLAAAGVALAFLVWCTPRVQVSVAATVNGAGHRAAAGAAPAADKGGHSTVSVRSDTAAAADVPAQTVPRKEDATSVSSAGAAAGAGAVSQLPSGGTTALLLAVDHQLQALERELGELELLLAAGNVHPRATLLVRRLHAEIERLKQRRAALREHATSWE